MAWTGRAHLWQLVIAAQEADARRVRELEREEEHNDLEGVRAPVHIVAEEEVVGKEQVTARTARTRAAHWRARGAAAEAAAVRTAAEQPAAARAAAARVRVT